MKHVAELRLLVSDFAARCRVARWFGAGFWVARTEIVVADVAAGEARAAKLAHENECAEIEVERELGGLLGSVPAPELCRAIRSLQRCERRNHKIGEVLTD
jgi:hypothetical protein